MRLSALCTLCALLPLAASAEESVGLQPGPGWNCTAAAPGLPRVCGSRHQVYEPPKVITQTIEIERPVPVPVYQPPVVQYVPAPVYVPRPVYRPRPPHGYPRPPYPDHRPSRRF
jgi:hypothetical protein